MMQQRLAGMAKTGITIAHSLEQKHLDEGTIERAYWHYGYAVALRDILAFLLPEGGVN